METEGLGRICVLCGRRVLCVQRSRYLRVCRAILVDGLSVGVLCELREGSLVDSISCLIPFTFNMVICVAAVIGTCLLVCTLDYPV